MTARTRIGALMGEALAPGPEPTGTAAWLDGDPALSFERHLRAEPERAWSMLTDLDLGERWAGQWFFDPGSEVVAFHGLTEGFETEVVRYHLAAFVPGRRLELSTSARPDEIPWRIRLDLAGDPSGGTRLTLVQTVPDPAFTPLVGAASDFYLDRLVAVDQGRDPARIVYDDYVVAQAAHYRALFPRQWGHGSAVRA